MPKYSEMRRGVPPFSTVFVEVGVAIRVMSSRMSCLRETDDGTVIGEDSG
jgi:hypothetical protein